MKITRSDFGDKVMQEKLASNPTLRWFQDTKRPTKSLSKADKIISKVGVTLVECVKRRYDLYLEKPTPANAKDYCLWRLRLHIRLENNREKLEEVNQARSLGLYDENPGPLCFEYNFD